MAADRLGSLVRLWGVKTAILPPRTASPDELVPLLLSITQEALPFIDSADAPQTAGAAEARWTSKGSRKLSGSTAPVELMERRIPAADLRRVASGAEDVATSAERAAAAEAGETWVCRRSLHVDAGEPGTASWAEFRDCLKDRHAETEAAFTPSMVAHRTAASWDCGGAEVELERAGAQGGRQRWGEFTLRLEEVRHSIGRPVLKDRVFAVLQLTCAALPAETAREFLVVNIPVSDLAPPAAAGGGDSGPAGDAPAAKLAAEWGVVVGAYVSVERVRKVSDVAGGSSIEWLMATASDAGGVLPMWIQTMAVPGQIAKDVALFLSWMAGQRGQQHRQDG